MMEEATSRPSRTGGAERREEKRRLASMVSVRLSPEEEQAVREAAAERGESVSNFMRQVVLAEVRPRPVAPLAAATTPSWTTAIGVTLEYVEGGKLMPRSGAPTIEPT